MEAFLEEFICDDTFPGILCEIFADGSEIAVKSSVLVGRKYWDILIS